MNLEIITCPIIREADGLAMSSRNVYLNSEERKAALVLSQSLFNAQKLVESGERSKEKIYKSIYGHISSESLANIEYIEIVDADTLENINNIEKRALIALAVRFGNTRLIDNIILEV
jgi:pantoate--beta-alanine ligase